MWQSNLVPRPPRPAFRTNAGRRDLGTRLWV